MSDNLSRDVVITGIGVFSPIGIGRDAFWTSIAEGRSGVRKVELLPYVGTPGCVGGEVSDFNDKTARKEHLKAMRKSLKVMCREIQLGVAAAIQGMEDAGIANGTIAPERIGVEFGANLMSSPPEVVAGAAAKASSVVDGHRRFDYDRWGQEGLSGMEPLWLLRYLPNMPGCHIGIALDARGPNNSLTHDEASGGLAVAEAVNIIRRDRADVMVTGVTGTRLHAVKACQYHHWDILADGPAAERVKPFDAHRTGEVLSECACVLILEERGHAEARGAKILGTVLGCGSSTVVAKDGTPDEKTAVRQAAEAALRNADVTCEDIGHINASGSGHPNRDQLEATGLRDLFGAAIDSVPVTAFKSYMGSTGSGAGLTEVAGSLLGLQQGLVPRTLNFTEADPNARLNVVHGEHLATDNRIFLKTSVTRMGQASALVIRSEG